jgi:hypothetical protein
MTLARLHWIHLRGVIAAPSAWFAMARTARLSPAVGVRAT